MTSPPDTRQLIADQEWAAVERDAETCLGEIDDLSRETHVADDVRARMDVVNAYLDALRSRHQREVERLTSERDEARAALKLRDERIGLLVDRLLPLRGAVRALLDDPAVLTVKHDCALSPEEERVILDRVNALLHRLEELCPKGVAHE